jgi:hypothetical protein
VTARSGLRAVWREQRLLLVIVMAYTATVYVAELRAGLRTPLANVGFRNFYVLFVLAGIAYAAAALLSARARVRDQSGRWLASWSGWRLAWQDCRARLFTPYRVGTVVTVSFAVLTLLRTYASWKPLIARVHPYGRVDLRLAQLDATLHFGHDPWRLLQPLLGHPSVTLSIDLLYALWLPLNFAVVLWHAAAAPPRERSRFLISYALAWIVLGTLMATWLSSAGPCYYGRVEGGPDPYTPLMAYLGNIHGTTGLIALKIQENLWSYYVGSEVLPLNGISAMPSMHVAGAVLFALAGWSAGKWAGVGLTLFAVIVFIGSVHLGWHYALDGYAGALGALLLWWLAGRLGRDVPLP